MDFRPFGDLSDQTDSFRQHVTADQMDMLRSDARFLMASRFPWDEFAGVASSESQILSPPDLLSLPLYDVPSQKEKLLTDSQSGHPFNPLSVLRNWLHPTPQDPAKKIASLQEFVAQQALIAPLPKQSPPMPEPIVIPAPTALPEKPVVPSSTTSPASPVSKSKKKGRKKGRPELQRKKRSEMNDRFFHLKKLLRDDISHSNVIGRGDRSTNSKEAILRIASNRIQRAQKEIANLEKEVAAARAKKDAGRRSTSTMSSSSVSSSNSLAVTLPSDLVNSSSTPIIDYSMLYDRSSIARVLMTLDGVVVDFNDLVPTMYDVDVPQFKALLVKETVFTLTHPECLPAVFANLSDLLGGSRCVTYLVDAKGVATWKNRLPVFSSMTWISHGTPCPTSGQRPVYVDSLIVQTGWCLPSSTEVRRLVVPDGAALS